MSNPGTMAPKKKWYERMPHSYVILFAVIVIAAILTWILPAGEFAREGRQVIPGTYGLVEQAGVGPFALFMAIPQGMVAASSIIFLIMISTAALAVIRESGALDNGIGSALERAKKSKGSTPVVIFVVTFLFSILGVLIGPEMHLPFLILGMSIAVSLKLDAIVGLGMVVGGGWTGFMFGPINAALLGTAHSIMGMPIFSGQGLRWVMWFCATLVVCMFNIWYARKITKNPEKSYVKDMDYSQFKLTTDDGTYKVTGRHVSVLLVLLGIFAATVIGASQFGWHLTEMATIFLIGGILAGFVNGWSINKIIEIFIRGVSSAAPIALVVGIARAIQVVLEDGRIMDTIIYHLSGPLLEFSPIVGAFFITVIVGLFRFLIPSASGLAFSILPVLGPLGILIGISEQTTVLAFQIGATIPMFIWPTAAVLIAALGIANVPLIKWYRYALPLTFFIAVLSSVFLGIAFAIGY